MMAIGSQLNTMPDLTGTACDGVLVPCGSGVGCGVGAVSEGTPGTQRGPENANRPCNPAPTATMTQSTATMPTTKADCTLFRFT